MTAAEDEIELVDYLRFVLSRKWFIIIGVLLSTVTVYLYTLTLPKIYTATAKILILKKPKFQVKSETKLITEDAEVGVNTQMNLLYSQEIARRVLSVLSAKFPEQVKNLTPQDILGSGTTSQISNTDLVELTVRNKDPELAKEICFYWATEAIKYNDEIYSSENKDINNIVIKQYADVKTGMADTEAKIMSFVTKNLRVSKEVIDSTKKTFIKNTGQIDVIDEYIEKFEKELSLLLSITGNNTLVSVERYLAALSSDLDNKKANINILKKKLTEFVSKSNNDDKSVMFTIPIDNLNPNSDVTINAETDFLKSQGAGSPKLKDEDSKETEKSPASSIIDPEISITAKKDPMVFKTELSISSLEIAVANLEFSIKRIQNGLPELNNLFSKLIKIKWLSLKGEELINMVTGFKLDLNHYIDFPRVGEIDNILNDILIYAQKKSFLVQLKEKNEQITFELKQYDINNEHYDLAIDKLKADYNFLKSSYETLGKKLEENRVQSGITPSNIKIVEPPFTPISHSSPNTKKIIMITIFASAFMFTFLAFLLNALKKERITK